jgi:RIO kinase 1
LVFKDRDRYVTGEHRWRRGYCKSNPRKMVKLWAEKEMRNLKRLNQAGIPSPTPLLLKAHVLLMTFIGDDGNAAPRLKDASLSSSQMRSAYHQAVRLLRCMYHVCHLVHADLSEYNLLYHRQSLVVIDVSQAVEHDHPHALVFLKKDVSNINRFFAQGGAVNVLSDAELFGFVLKAGMSDAEEDEWMQRMMRVERKERDGGEVDGVFVDSFVPRRLDEVEDEEREFNAAMDGSDTALHAAIRAMTVESKTGGEEGKEVDDEVDDGTEESEDDEDDSDDDEEDEEEEEGEELQRTVERLRATLQPSEAVEEETMAVAAPQGRPLSRPRVPRLTAVERRARDKTKGDGRRGRRGGAEGEDDDAEEAVRDRNASDSDDDSDEVQQEDEDSDEDESDEDGEDDGQGDAETRRDGPAVDADSARAAAKADRKAAKKATKAAQAEKRKTKIPKKEKKRKMKAASRAKH